jgi:hypothetical protein
VLVEGVDEMADVVAAGAEVAGDNGAGFQEGCSSTSACCLGFKANWFLTSAALRKVVYWYFDDTVRFSAFPDDALQMLNGFG